ncbi:hypothetical protein [Reichenbachiella ulvae]|uniref:PH domain-containing protein n=1 Tax=Reichenbachiella ulvae TaxID=2980104 RepID=A0ABT3CTH7_9BACT|nr:hypothetical protein [Reichenbachiella ulvae]MCV9386858.1 hypothetical protein [Reichenbachiella ulvae]
MKTHKASYYFHRILPLAIGVFLLRMVILSIISPDEITTIVNGEEVETTFLTALPALVIGLPMLFFGIWLFGNYFRVYMDEEVIQVLGKNKQKYNWSDIESIEPVNWLWKGTIFKLKPKNQKRLYFFSDKPNMKFNNQFTPTFETQMNLLISKKKRDLSI